MLDQTRQPKTAHELHEMWQAFQGLERHTSDLRKQLMMVADAERGRAFYRCHLQAEGGEVTQEQVDLALATVVVPYTERIAELDKEIAALRIQVKTAYKAYEQAQVQQKEDSREQTK